MFLPINRHEERATILGATYEYMEYAPTGSEKEKDYETNGNYQKLISNQYESRTKIDQYINGFSWTTGITNYIHTKLTLLDRFLYKISNSYARSTIQIDNFKVECRNLTALTEQIKSVIMTSDHNKVYPKGDIVVNHLYFSVEKQRQAQISSGPENLHSGRISI